MKNNIKIIAKIIIMVVAAFFFLPVFTVSCAGTNIDVSAAHSMIGYESRELGNLSEPQFMLIALLLIPIAMLIIGGIKRAHTQTEVIINTVLAVCEIVGYLLFRSGVKEYANKNMCSFSEEVGFYIVIILCVLVVIGYISLFLIGSQDPVSAAVSLAGKAEFKSVDGNIQPVLSHQKENGWICSCGKNNANDSLFCARCGSRKPVETVEKVKTYAWSCSCGNVMKEDSLFCSKCGSKRPEEVQVIQEEEPVKASGWVCSCGNVLDDAAAFCGNCGSKRPE